MNPDLNSGSPIHLPDDFAERVLREVDRRRTRSRGMRTLGAGLVLTAALVVVGRLPLRLAHRHPVEPGVVELTTSAEIDELDDDSDLDPGSYFLASGETLPAAGEGDSDSLGQE